MANRHVPAVDPAVKNLLLAQLRDQRKIVRREEDLFYALIIKCVAPDGPFTHQGLADDLGVHRKTIWRWVKEGRIRAAAEAGDQGARGGLG